MTMRRHFGSVFDFWMRSGLLPVAILLACQAAFTKFAISQTEWIVIGITLYSICFEAWNEQVQRAEVAEAANAKAKQNATRSFVADTRRILDAYGQAGIDAESRLVAYLGKWVIIDGAFAGMAVSLQRDAIHLTLESSGGRKVHVRFPVDPLERLQALRQGQRIRVVCQIGHGYGLGVMALESGELVWAEPLGQGRRADLARVS